MPSAPRPPSRALGLRALGIALPAVAVLLASPVTLLALLRLPDLEAALLVAPTALAALAAPGYLKAVLGWVPIPVLRPATRLWVRTSFVAGLLASALGVVAGLAWVLPGLAAIFTAWTAWTIWERLEVRPRPRAA